MLAFFITTDCNIYLNISLKGLWGGLKFITSTDRYLSPIEVTIWQEFNSSLNTCQEAGKIKHTSFRVRSTAATTAGYIEILKKGHV